MKTSISSRFGLLAIPLAVMSTPSVHALTITPIYDASFTSQPNFAALQQTVNNAIATYAKFPDNQTIPINFELSGAISGAQSSFLVGSYSFASYRTALTSRVSSANDGMALASIGLGPNDPVLNQANISITQALAVTLGLDAAAANYGTVTFNTGVYSTNPAGFLGTIQHEVNEALGTASNLPNFSAGAQLPSMIAPSDLFRYAADGTRNYTLNAANDPANKAFFRLSPNGSTIQEWNDLPNGGDYGDWYVGPNDLFGPAPQDQTGDANTFTSMETSPNGSEFVLLDAIGYTIPEPTSLALLASTALLGCIPRRTRVPRS